jgi:hypothetical protein
VSSPEIQSQKKFNRRDRRVRGENLNSLELGGERQFAFLRLAGGGAQDFGSDLIEWKYFVGQSSASHEARHSPHNAGGFVLHHDAPARSLERFTSF